MLQGWQEEGVKPKSVTGVQDPLVFPKVAGPQKRVVKIIIRTRNGQEDHFFTCPSCSLSYRDELREPNTQDHIAEGVENCAQCKIPFTKTSDKALTYPDYVELQKNLDTRKVSSFDAYGEE